MNSPNASPPLVAPREKLNFFHEDQQLIDTAITAIQAYTLMTAQPPAWLNLAFKIRDVLSLKLGGVQPIQGFDSSQPNSVKENDKLDFFDVVKISEDALFLQSTDTHLRVLVALQISPYDTLNNHLKITTSVETYNFFGKIYMIPVSAVHGLIVRNMLKKINQVKG